MARNNQTGAVMKRRHLVQGLLAGALLLTPLARALAKHLLDYNGALPAPAGIQRVFAAGPPAAVFLYTLVPEKLLGWPMSLAPENLTFIHADQQHLPYIGRLAGRGSTVSLETLVLLAPDVIVDVGNAGNTHRSAAKRVTQQTGIATLQIEGLLAQTPAQLREAGALLGVRERAEQLAVYSEKLLARAARFAHQQAKKPTKVYFARSYDGLETGLAGSIHSEVIELLGCENVAKQTGHKGIGQISLEQLLTWQPDYLLSQDQEFVQLANTAPQWQALTAVQSGRVYSAPKIPFGWLDGPPGVNRLLGVLWLMALLEERLDGQQLQDEVAEFFSLFYRSVDSPAHLLRAVVN